MPERGGQFDKADRCPGSVERVSDRAAFGGRVEPVGIEADQAEPHRAACKGQGEFAAPLTAKTLFRKIKIVHRSRDIEV